MRTLALVLCLIPAAVGAQHAGPHGPEPRSPTRTIIRVVPLIVWEHGPNGWYPTAPGGRALPPSRWLYRIAPPIIVWEHGAAGWVPTAPGGQPLVVRPEGLIRWSRP